jgi:NitT/TauT family transport system ATP-binding protein
MVQSEQSARHAAHIAIEHAGVTFATSYGSITALRDISLHVQAGEFVAVVGPSGCGKSTLLRAVGGLVAASTGSIHVQGMHPEQARLARMVSFVFQQPVLLPWYTARQNVALPLKLFGQRRQQRHEAAMRCLHLVGLSQFASAYPFQLSGGMQQRVALARALAFEPAVLLMDEPFSALDEITREHLNTELLRIWSSTPATVLFVTHSLTEAAFLADRVVMLSRQPGHIIADIPIGFARPRIADLLGQNDFLHCVADLRQRLIASTHTQP